MFLVPVAAVLKTRWRQSSLYFSAILKGNIVFKVLLGYLPGDETPFYRGSERFSGIERS